MSLDGPRMGPASGGPAQELVVLLHGVGANGQDLLGLAPHFAKVAPHAAFVSPNAHQAFPGMPDRYQWFPIPAAADINDVYVADQVAAAGPTLNQFLDDELARTGVAADRLALIGFSQGTMMALQVGLRRETAPLAVIGYSGLLAGPGRLTSELKSRPPVLLVHGDRDPVVPFLYMERAAEALGDVDVPVLTHASQGVEHYINDDGVMMGMKFLQKAVVAEFEHPKY